MPIERLIIYPISNGGAETWELPATLKFTVGGKEISHQHDPKSTEPESYQCHFEQDAGTYFEGNLNTYDRQEGQGYQVSQHFPKVTDEKELHIRITGRGPFLSFSMNLKAE